MKKVITAIVVIGVLVGVYYYVRTHAQVQFGILTGKWVESYRGDLVVPITASGKIEPAKVVKIKGEASGEVVTTPFMDGAMVAKGDLIVRLDPSDEQINVDRARAGYEGSRIALERARLSLRERKEIGLPLAKAKLQQVKARFDLATLDFEHQKKLKAIRETGASGLDPSSEREFAEAQARFQEAQALYDAAKVEREQAQIAVQLAELEVDSAQEQLKNTQKNLEDAQERLNETEVFSPIDGMVLSREVQIGEVVQSGKTSLTGGTVLMTIAEVSDIYAVVNVDEADIGQVRQLAPASAVPGMVATQPATLPAGMIDQEARVEVTVESFRDEKFFGAIERIAPQSQLIQAIATFKVWIRITSDNKGKLIGLLNTQAEAHFTVNSVRDAVLVSYDAIKRNPQGEGYGVYLRVVDPETGKADEDFQECEFGMDNGIDVEVVRGLEPGVEVYTVRPQKTRREKEAEEGDD